LYTPAAGRVRQACCHHLYNCETILHTIVSRDTLQPKQEPNKIADDEVNNKCSIEIRLPDIS